MNRFEAASTIFYFTAASDGEIAPHELEVMAQFYAAQGRTIEDLAEDLAALKKAHQGATPLVAFGQLALAADVIRNNCSEPERAALLEAVILTVLADGVLEDAERAVVLLLSNLWGLDPDAVVAAAIARGDAAAS